MADIVLPGVMDDCWVVGGWCPPCTHLRWQQRIRSVRRSFSLIVTRWIWISFKFIKSFAWIIFIFIFICSLIWEKIGIPPLFGSLSSLFAFLYLHMQMKWNSSRNFNHKIMVLENGEYLAITQIPCRCKPSALLLAILTGLVWDWLMYVIHLIISSI